MPGFDDVKQIAFTYCEREFSRKDDVIYYLFLRLLIERESRLSVLQLCE